MQFSHIKYVYFLGIGGIGMSALARWFNVNGFQVAGYDKTPTALTNTLQAEGIRIHFDDDVNAIPSEFLANPAQTLVVLTPAIPKDHQEWNFLIDNNFQILKRSQVLGLLAATMRTIAVAGTHGKTTTSSMVAHILKASGKNVAAFLGGITQNYQTNFLLNDPTDDLSSVLCVVEADEFDRSFLTLFPDVAVVTSTDADHLDIYGDHNHVLESFQAFVGQIKSDGKLFMKKGLSLASHTQAQVQDFSFDSGDFHATNFRIENARFVFDVVYPGGVVADIQLMMPGFHNVENALAAFACAWVVGTDNEQIRAALNTYKGVKRRFEYHHQSPTKVLIDDYAHHPAEVEAFLRSVRALYPNKHITAIFQPHLFTRTRDFQEGFAASLGLADRLLLLDIYPAREKPIEGISSKIVFDRVPLSDKILLSKSEVIQTLTNLPAEVVVTIGAGDVDGLLPALKEMLLIDS